MTRDIWITCPTCHGLGRDGDDEPCKDCNGTGKVRTSV